MMGAVGRPCGAGWGREGHELGALLVGVTRPHSVRLGVMQHGGEVGEHIVLCCGQPIGKDQKFWSNDDLSVRIIIEEPEREDFECLM